MASPEKDTFLAVAERMRGGTSAQALARIGITAASFALPPFRPLYRTVRADWDETVKQPVHPPLDDTLQTISQHLESFLPLSSTDPLTTKQQSWFANVLFQFSDRNGLATAMSTPYEVVDSLHEAIIDQAKHGPVTPSEQLRLALEHAPTIPSAVWNLFIASRHFARWRDSPAIDGLPHMSEDTALTLMREWQASLTAAKSTSDTVPYQDAAGDTYYLWTHALARIMYTALPEKRTPLSKAYEVAFRYGSHFMSASHQLGRLSVIGTMSNHIPASIYGNAIGDTLANAVKKSPT